MPGRTMSTSVFRKTRGTDAAQASDLIGAALLFAMSSPAALKATGAPRRPRQILNEPVGGYPAIRTCVHAVLRSDAQSG